MPTVEELRIRYRSYSVEELAELSRSELTEDARTALAEELEARTLGTEDLPPASAEAPVRAHRGWITVFQIVVIVGVASQMVVTLRSFLAIDAPLLRILPYLLVGESLAAIPIFGLVLIARRSRLTRKFWLWYLGITAGFVLFTALFATGITFDVLARLAFVVAWFLYWHQSERVCVEFGLPRLKMPTGPRDDALGRETRADPAEDVSTDGRPENAA